MFFYGPHLLALFVAGVRADDPHNAVALDDLALVAYFPYRYSHFHCVPLIAIPAPLASRHINFSNGILSCRGSDHMAKAQP
jgi:hypothetical protein